MDTGDDKILKYKAKLIREQLKKQIMAKGSGTLRSITLYFKRMDNTLGKHCNFDQRSLTKEEFINGCKRLNIMISKEDIDIFFAYFDKNKNGTLDFEEFLVGIRGQMNEERSRICLKIFKLLDKTKDNVITVDDIREYYDISFHPKKNELSKDEILKQFLNNFEKGGGIIIRGRWYCYRDGMDELLRCSKLLN